LMKQFCVTTAYDVVDDLKAGDIVLKGAMRSTGVVRPPCRLRIQREERLSPLSQR
jgi:hypothetical protein